MNLQWSDEVVVVIAPNKELIPGKVFSGKVGAIGLDETISADVQMVRRISIDGVVHDEDKAIIGKYPECIIATKPMVFPRDDFYSGKIDPENYIHPKYKLGDYILGFTNTECNNGSFRLVGGFIESVKIVPKINFCRYSYRILYGINIEVSYSIEQLCRDGAESDKKYCIDPSLRQLSGSSQYSYYCIIDEELTVSFDNAPKNCRPGRVDDVNYSGLAYSERYTLFYVMASLLILASAKNLTSDDMDGIAYAILEQTYFSLFEKSEQNSDIKTQQQLCQYELPFRQIIKNMFYGISKSFAYPMLESYFMEGMDIIVKDMCTIPAKHVLSIPNVSEILSNPYITGISHEEFSRVLIAFAISVIENKQQFLKDGVCNIFDMADMLFGCMNSQIKQGTVVHLNNNALFHDFDDATRVLIMRDFEKCTRFMVTNIHSNGIATIVAESYYRDTSNKCDEITYDVPVSVIRATSDDVISDNHNIFMKSFSELSDVLESYKGEFHIKSTKLTDERFS